MQHAVVDRCLLYVKRVNILKTSDIETELLWIRASLVVGVDSTGGAEIVFRCVGIELVAAKMVGAFDDSQSADGSRGHDAAASFAHRTVAMSRVDESLR